MPGIEQKALEAFEGIDHPPAAKASDETDIAELIHTTSLRSCQRCPRLGGRAPIIPQPAWAGKYERFHAARLCTRQRP
ncbi:hypothetical protein GCM10007421_26660 [Halopseudomonas oceani]|nr:hypothetical protein GCM10007421_26660 [Halopseudomonas oceani]